MLTFSCFIISVITNTLKPAIRMYHCQIGKWYLRYDLFLKGLGLPLDHPRVVFPQCLGGRRRWHPTPVLLPGKSHGWRSLVGCSPWGREELDTTEWLHFHFPLSCIAEGNGNPVQRSCLENPRDWGAWWAAIYGVAQSQTRLKWLSSSSSALVSSKCYIHLWWLPNRDS